VPADDSNRVAGLRGPWDHGGMRRPTLLIAVAAASLAGVACGEASPPPFVQPSPGSTTMGAAAARLFIATAEGEVTVEVEVADSASERRVGLMNRASLPEDAGMVFLFEEPSDGGFWMKNTRIPLSIAFWSEEGRILAILDMQPCEADPCPVYDPGVGFVGALEVNQGFFDRRGVRVGDRIEMEPGPG
jgi:uncharacterized membrane protein (UPF0127 family)